MQYKLEIERDPDGQGDLLLCPVCEDRYEHLEGSRNFSTYDGRPDIQLTFWCEQDHRYTVTFRQQKGYTYVEVEA